ncbi:MAG: DUF177 domain-containing protein [Lentisphaerae bacterium]|nr:DUF177 domain-containing protein [Lentisphaerota bacterium]
MQIVVAHIKFEGQKISGEESPDILEMEEDQYFLPAGNVEYDFFVQPAGSELLVRGSLKAEFKSVCGRCGSDCIFVAEQKSFLRSYPFHDKSVIIDLTEDIREEIILTLPFVSLCSSDCKGICSHCGTNLNKAKCKCQISETSNAWDVLDKLKV